MYNSFIVGISVKIWKAILHGYQGSNMKKIVNGINRFISYLLKGSIVGNFFISDKDSIKETLFYKITSTIIDFLNKILGGINKYIKKTGQDSIVYRNIKKIFQGKIQVLESLLIFILSLGLGVIGNNIFRGYYSGKSYMVSIFFIVISLVGLGLKENYEEIINSSMFYNFVASIFTMDGEGGDNWW